MTFRITGLDPSAFRHLFGRSEEELRASGAVRYVARADSGFPDRIELRDVPAGASVILVNHVHQPAATPYRASHAIFVREGAEKRFDAVGTIPPAFRSRTMSLRGFDASHMMAAGELVDGEEVETLIERMLEDPEVAYIHAHFARRGCFAARIDRV